MRDPRKHPVPISGVVYGEIIYWLTVGSSFVVLLGTIISFVETQSLVSSAYILQSVFNGKNVEEIWLGSDISRIRILNFIWRHLTLVKA